jgi:raffinose/stachyose/melibiose transport system permease protein
VARFRRHLGRELVFIALCAWAVLQLAPLVFVVFNALKTNAEFIADPIGPPSSFRIENFVEAFNGGPSALPVGSYLLNSFVVTSASVVLVLVLGAMAAYTISRLRYPGARLVSGFSFLMLAIPVAVTLIPIYLFVGQLGLRNNLLGLIVVYAAFWLPLSILLLRGFYDSFSKDIEDAARIDGCTEIGVFRHVVLPLSTGPMVGVAVITAVGVWSELLFALALSSKNDVRTVTVGLMQFRTAYFTDWHLLFAGLTISILPVFILYLIFQRRIQAGLASSAIR